MRTLKALRAYTAASWAGMIGRKSPVSYAVNATPNAERSMHAPAHRLRHVTELLEATERQQASLAEQVKP